MEQRPELLWTVFNFKLMLFSKNVQIKLLEEISTK